MSIPEISFFIAVAIILFCTFMERLQQRKKLELMKALYDKQGEQGWIISNAGDTAWRTLDDFGQSIWVNSPELALRFHRRQDAELWMFQDEDAWHLRTYRQTLALLERGHFDKTQPITPATAPGVHEMRPTDFMRKHPGDDSNIKSQTVLHARGSGHDSSYEVHNGEKFYTGGVLRGLDGSAYVVGEALGHTMGQRRAARDLGVFGMPPREEVIVPIRRGRTDQDFTKD